MSSVGSTAQIPPSPLNRGVSTHRWGPWESPRAESAAFLLLYGLGWAQTHKMPLVFGRGAQGPLGPQGAPWGSHGASRLAFIDSAHLTRWLESISSEIPMATTASRWARKDGPDRDAPATLSAANSAPWGPWAVAQRARARWVAWRLESANRSQSRRRTASENGRRPGDDDLGPPAQRPAART